MQFLLALALIALASLFVSKLVRLGIIDLELGRPALRLAHPTALAMLAVFLVGTAALAADPGAPPASMLSTLWTTYALPALMAGIFDPKVWVVVLVAAYLVLQHFDAKRAAIVKAAIVSVYHQVENLKQLGLLNPAIAALKTVSPTAGNAIGKAEVGADLLAKTLDDTHGLTVTANELALAKSTWDAMHGAAGDPAAAAAASAAAATPAVAVAKS